jgi:hypothetical protein
MNEAGLTGGTTAKVGDWVRILAGDHADRRGRIVAIGDHSVRVGVKVGPFAHDPVVEVRLGSDQFRVLSPGHRGSN